MARFSTQRHAVALVSMVGLAAILVVSIVVTVGIGPVHIPVGAIVEVIGRRLGWGFSASVLDDEIVWQLRLPRVLAACAVGAALALCGCILQSVTRNDLADPYLLGVSGGASVGAVAVLLLGVNIGLFANTTISGTAVTAGAFIGALIAVCLVFILSTSRHGEMPPSRTILAGIAIGQACSAFVSFSIIIFGNRDSAHQVLIWTLGSLGGIRWGSALTLCLVSILGLAIFLYFSRDLDALTFGETSARSLGINVRAVRWILLIITALVTATMVAFTGVIGFIGLVVPHIVRLLIGNSHYYVLPLSALTGAILLVWSDALSHSMFTNQEIPIGVMTAAIGAPFFAWLLRRERR